MRKSILIVIFSFIFCLGFAQKTKKRVNYNIDKIEKIEVSAKKWFKDHYVRGFFKDPYSYKFLKCHAISVNQGEELEKKMSKLEGTIRGGNYTKEKRPNSYNGSLKRLHEEAIAEYEPLKQKYDSLSDAEKNSVLYYLVYIDCYAKNSYGNEVLGKYQFKADKDGKFDLNSVEDISPR